MNWFGTKKARFILIFSVAFIFLGSLGVFVWYTKFSNTANLKHESTGEVAAATVSSTPQKEEKTLPLMPVRDKSILVPEVTAQSTFAFDVDSKTVLFEKNPDQEQLPASTTKIMTALVSLNYYPLDAVLKVPSGMNIDGQKMHLIAGEEITVKNLLYGLLVFSANDAAEVLAYNYPGGKASFIEAMNRKALEMKMVNTRFANPSGLDNQYQKTTARDLSFLTLSVLSNETLMEIVGTKRITVTNVDGTIPHRLGNINELLGTVPGVLGVKTGWTENAGENLVTYIDRDNKKVIIVLLGSTDRFGETKTLIDWIYTHYYWTPIDEVMP